MKSLAIIWIAAVIAAVGTVSYVNAEINKLVVRRAPSSGLQETIDGSKLQPATGLQVSTYNPQQTVNASYLQGGR